VLYIKLGAARVVDVPAVSVQRHRNVFSNVPDAVYVFRITTGNVTNGHHLLTAALQVGIAGLTTVIDPVVVDLLSWPSIPTTTALLKQWLSPEQLAQYESHRYFDVIGRPSGKHYRIRYGTAMNIREMDSRGRASVGWCFVPHGTLVAGGVMLAQKIALETDERSALAEARKFAAVQRTIPIIC
jgi:hypothetical protein